MKRLVKFSIIILLVGVLAYNFFPYISSQVAPPAEAMSQTELDKLKAEQAELQKKLEQLKKSSTAIGNQIASEEKNVKTLAQQAAYIEKVLEQSVIQKDIIEQELAVLNKDVSIKTKELETMQGEYEHVKEGLKKANEEQKALMNELLKLAYNTPTILDSKSSFEGVIEGQKKRESFLRIVKANLKRITDLEVEVKTKTEEIAATQKQLVDAQNAKKAQSENLALQQQSLAWQKQNKAMLAEQARQKQEILAQNKDELYKQITEAEQKLNVIRSRLLSLPPSGAPIRAGQVIGQQGATGFVTGSHLHFEYRLPGATSNVDPEKYRKTFTVQPMDKMTITSYFGPRCFPYNGKNYCDNHIGADYINYDGAPIYAVKSGKVDYYCDQYGGLGAIVFHDDGSRSLYWHLKKVPTCKK